MGQKFMKRVIPTILIVLTLLLPAWSAWGLDVVPGLKGFGADTRAAYGNSQNPTICIVDDLTNNDGALANGTRNGVSVKLGSFRECLNYDVDNKLIIFEVSGYIDFAWQNARIDNNYVTVAGQTAPSPGVTFKRAQLWVREVNDILVQHVRVRSGDEDDSPTGDNRDSLVITERDAGQLAPCYNVVVDHCSFSWAVDENASIWQQFPADGASPHDITIANCIISEGLSGSIHPDDHEHSRGLLVGANSDNIAILKNLFAHNHSRNPVIYNGTTYVANNVMYNGKEYNGVRAIPYYDALMDLTMIGNVSIRGSESTDNHSKNALTIYGSNPYAGQTKRFYLLDNISENDTDGDASGDDWDGVYDPGAFEGVYRVGAAPITATGYTPLASEDTEAHVLLNSGARPADRDVVDNRIVTEVTNETGTYIDIITRTVADCTGLHTPMYCCTGSGTGNCNRNDEAGYPTLNENTRNVETGMAADGLPTFPSDPHGDDDLDGYTNLEEWLHTLAAFVEGGTPVINENNNDPSNDPNLEARWEFNTGDFLTDTSTSSNLLVDPGSPATENTTLAILGTADADFESLSSQYLKVTDGNLSADFIGKNGTTNRIGSILTRLNMESLPGEGGGNIQYDDNGSGSDDNWCLTLTFAHTVASQSNRMLVVMAGSYNTVNITGVTYNGIAMTGLAQQTNGALTGRMFYLIGPATGTHNVIVTSSGLAPVYGAAITIYGVKQQAPEANNGTSVEAATISCGVTSITNNAWVVTGVVHSNVSAIAPTHGETERKEHQAASDTVAIATKEIAVAGPNTFGYGDNAGRWAFTAAAFEPAAAIAGFMTIDSKWSAGKECWKFGVYDDAGTSKLRLMLYDGAATKTYTHASGLSAGTEYALMWGWSHTPNTAYIDVASKIGDTWTRLGTRIEDSTNDFDLNISNADFEIGSHSEGYEYFDGNQDEKWHMADVITASQFVDYASGEYGDPPPSISSITVTTETISTSGIIKDVEVIWSEECYHVGTPAHFTAELGAGGLEVEVYYSSKVGATETWITEEVQDGWRGVFAVKDADITVPAGGSVKDLQGEDATTTTVAVTNTATYAVTYPSTNPKEFSSSSTLAAAQAAGFYGIGDDNYLCTTANAIGAADMNASDGSDGHPIKLNGGGLSQPGSQTYGDWWEITRVTHD